MQPALVPSLAWRDHVINKQNMNLPEIYPLPVETQS